jgi:hypothetical protein
MASAWLLLGMVSSAGTLAAPGEGGRFDSVHGWSGRAGGGGGGGICRIMMQGGSSRIKGGFGVPRLRGGGEVEDTVLHDAVGAMAEMEITRLFHVPGPEDAICPDDFSSVRTCVRGARRKQRCYIRRGRHTLSRPLIVRGRGQGGRVVHVSGERGDDGAGGAWTEVKTCTPSEPAL